MTFNSKYSFVQKLQYGLVQTAYPLRSKEARRWIAKKISDMGARVNVQSIVKQAPANRKRRTFTSSMVGKMFFFFYDPKGKATMDYYDKFPLVLPIEKYQDGFLGLNFHYLPLRFRAALLDKIEIYANNKKMDETTRIRITYHILSSVPKYKMFKPCLKRYLWTQIQSPLVQITPDQYDIAIFLPAERFSGETKQAVFKESVKKVFDIEEPNVKPIEKEEEPVKPTRWK